MDQNFPVRFLMIIAGDEDDAIRNHRLNITRIAPAYYLFRDMPAEVVLASPGGGFPAITITSPNHADAHSSAARTAMLRFQSDRAAREDIADTLRLDQIAVCDFAAAFCVGFSSHIWNDESHGLLPVLQAFLAEKKPVALIDADDLQITANDAGRGLLIIGNSDDSPSLAACAMIRIVKEKLGPRLPPLPD
ncbi:hypothetical protein [Thalassospira sp. A3_1]|uniref:hypothetical protein n=1 Tax=Thalassospira sp. A3_1 TaxID=2821088 RepID=UPI001ADCF3DE|nr:hypothetical protein [Thalassospira sp. A3_1]MBO9508473.1 hypothetical protein [Thalassospira sp. A3_1]